MDGNGRGCTHGHEHQAWTLHGHGHRWDTGIVMGKGHGHGYQTIRYPKFDSYFYTDTFHLVK
jgi:hypothetical protein